jgi:hypothetical protein
MNGYRLPLGATAELYPQVCGAWYEQNEGACSSRGMGRANGPSPRRPEAALINHIQVHFWMNVNIQSGM